jgi:NitT/TauT family transport system ATP-binding protein
MPIVTIDHVSHSFGEQSAEAVEVVRDVSLTVEEGEFVAFIGPSGCGKSTLLNMVAGLISPQHGSIHVKNKAVTGVDPSLGVGYMFARDGLMPWRTTLDNVALGLELRHVSDARERARKLLSIVGLSGFEHRYRAELSQGMRQRAALARTLATDPDLLLLDEPFGALDAQTKAVVEEEFMNIREERGSTVIFVTHDLMEAITLADRVVVMSARPAQIKAIMTVPITRPRSLTETRFAPEAEALYLKLWQELRPEVVAEQLREGLAS